MTSATESSIGQYAVPRLPTALTPEQLAALPHNNQAPQLLASIWALGLLATIFLALRIYCRRLRKQRLGWDDGILIASWVCVVVESALLTYMTTLGYGLHIWDFDANNLQAMILPTNVAGTFLVTGAVWSKTSFGVTLLLITDGWLRKLTWFCIISMNVVMFLSAIFPWVSCTPVQKAWDLTVQEGTCWDPRAIVDYNIFAAAYSASIYFTLAFLPWRFLWKLQMKRGEKIGVGVALSMGVFAGVTAVVKTTKLPQMMSSDFADGISLWIWGNAEVCSAIIAASIPMLRVLVRDASSRQRASGYYDKEAGVGNSFRRFVAIPGRPAQNSSRVELHKLGDDRSDRSILGGSGHELQAKSGILQVTDITVKYHEKLPPVPPRTARSKEFRR